jgi:glucosamine--fructose-6-phosphate aminotransferase (isomerizing)
MTNAVMLQDILSQPEALEEGLPSLRVQASELEFPRVQRLVLTGSGDSLIAALALRNLFQAHLRVPVLIRASLDASRYLDLTPEDAIVVVSVSGEVARTLEAATRANAAGASTVAITAAADSRLARMCDATLTIPAPIDRSIPHCRDYSVTALALACLLERFAEIRIGTLDELPSLVATTVKSALDSWSAVPATTGRTWFLGAGPDRATAMFGALKYWEAAGMEAWWDDLEEFGHGSQLMCRPNDRAVLIASGPGCQRALEMIGGLEKMGVDVALVGGRAMASDGRPHLQTTDDLDFRLHPFISCIPLQVMTYLEAEARGLDVTVPLFGHAHGLVYDEVHAEWMRQSRIVAADGSTS